MTDLVVISLEVWDDVWRRNQHLIAGLLRTSRVNRVLFVEPAVDIPHDLLSGRRPGRTGLRKLPLPDVDGDLWALRPVKVVPRRIDAGGDRRRAQKVITAARRLGMSRPVLWVNDPGGVEVLSTSGWPALYDITDDWLVADRPQAELARLRQQEARLFAECRQVVVCSQALVGTKSAHRDVTLIPNAVDLAPYRRLQPRPSDLPRGPIALYLGTAHRDRVDVDLVVETAHALRRRVGGTVVLVGPAPLPRQDLDRLGKAGVRVLGSRSSDTVPAYMQHADVLIVPHVLTPFTASLDPIKAYEYRAAGRAVVSTPVPGFIDTADPRVAAVPADRFPDAVAAAMGASVPWSQQDPSGLPTWSERVEQMGAVIARAESPRLSATDPP